MKAKLLLYKEYIIEFYYKHDYYIDLIIAAIITVVGILTVLIVGNSIAESYFRQFILDHQ